MKHLLIATALVLTAAQAQAQLNDGRIKRFTTQALLEAATSVPAGVTLGYAEDTDRLYVWDGADFQDVAPEKFLDINLEALPTGSIYLMQSDFTAYDSTAATLNIIEVGGKKLHAMMVVDGGNTVPTLDATGLDMTAGNTTDNDHMSYWSHSGYASGRPFIAGVDGGFYACWDVTVTDVSGTDLQYCGFRTPDPVTVTIASYTDYCAIGHISGNYGTQDKVTGATDSGSDTIADTEEDTWCVYVSADGVCSYTIDGVAVASADTHDFADGVMLVPFCDLRHNTDIAEDTIIGRWGPIGPQ